MISLRMTIELIIAFFIKIKAFKKIFWIEMRRSKIIERIASKLGFYIYNCKKI